MRPDTRLNAGKPVLYEASRNLIAPSEVLRLFAGDSRVSFLTIGNNKRFALRQAVSLRGPDGGILEGLLVEMSLSGCRISNLGKHALRLHDEVTAMLDGFDGLRAYVRWVGDGIVGLRLHRPLHCDGLERILGHCRTAQRGGELLRYGT